MAGIVRDARPPGGFLGNMNASERATRRWPPARRHLAAMLVCIPAAAEAAPNGLNEPIAVSFRGVAWRDALAEISDRLGVVCVLDADMPAEALDRPLRLVAEHLDGEQVLRWLARLGGVGVIVVDGRYLFGQPDGWPTAWQTRWYRSYAPPEDGPRVGDGRTADIAWVDQTPAAAFAEIRRHYEVDVIVDPAILARQDLLKITREAARLSDLLDEIAARWEAAWAFVDGAVAIGSPAWVRPPRAMPPGRARHDDRSASGRRIPANANPAVWEAWTWVDVKEKSWKKALWPMMQGVGEAAVWQADDDSRLGRAEWAVEAEGRVGELLEGLALLDYLRWQPLREASGADLRIRLR